VPAATPARVGAARGADLRVIKRCMLVMLLVLTLGVCWIAQELLIPLTLGILFGLLLSPIVSLLQRVRLPRAVGSALVLVAVIALLLGALASLAEPARDWVTNAPQTIRTIQHRFEDIRLPLREAREATKRIEDLTQSSSAPTVIATQPSLLTTVAASTPRAITAVMAVFILVYFFLAGGDTFLRRLVEVAPRLSEKKMVVSIARDVQGEISRYLVTVSLINLGLGVATALAMHFVGLPTPLLWGAMAALFNFVPYVGPATTGFALFVAGFTTFDSLGQALAAPGVFFALTLVEGQLITPTIVGRRLSLDPTIVFLWLMLWGWLWGVVGLLVAGPLLACFRIVCQHVEGLHAISVMIGDGSGAESSNRT
jgi:predicted PurR-regulated permease PerM